MGRPAAAVDRDDGPGVLGGQVHDSGGGGVGGTATAWLSALPITSPFYQVFDVGEDALVGAFHEGAGAGARVHLRLRMEGGRRVRERPRRQERRRSPDGSLSMGGGHVARARTFARRSSSNSHVDGVKQVWVLSKNHSGTHPPIVTPPLQHVHEGADVVISLGLWEAGKGQ